MSVELSMHNTTTMQLNFAIPPTMWFGGGWGVDKSMDAGVDMFYVTAYHQTPVIVDLISVGKARPLND